MQAEFDVDFGGGDLLSGTMWFDTVVGKTRMELDNGAVVVFDGEACWTSADAAEIPYGYRFHALTWPYFLAAPFKLSDPGVSHAFLASAPLTAKASSPASKMTFGAGVGDAPDDWYVVFANPTDGTLAALSYIVTYDKSAEEAEAKPSIVFYTQPETVDGVVFATELIFHFWDTETGVQGDPKGDMSVSSIAFVDAPAGAFDKPEGAMEAALPGAENDIATAAAGEVSDVAESDPLPEAEEAEAVKVELVTDDAMEASEDADATLTELAESAGEAVESAAEGVAEAAGDTVEVVVEVVEDAAEAVTPTE